MAAEDQAALRENWIAPVGVGLILALIVGAVAQWGTSTRDHVMLEQVLEKVGKISDTVQQNHELLNELQRNDAVQDERLKHLEESFQLLAQ